MKIHLNIFPLLTYLLAIFNEKHAKISKLTFEWLIALHHSLKVFIMIQYKSTFYAHTHKKPLKKNHQTRKFNFMNKQQSILWERLKQNQFLSECFFNCALFILFPPLIPFVCICVWVYLCFVLLSNHDKRKQHKKKVYNSA